MTTILLVDDEPLILMDLEFAAEDRGCTCLCAATLQQALAHVEEAGDTLDVAVLDVSLTDGDTCLPIARELEKRGIPYVIHSGDLDRQDEVIRSLDVPRLAKPTCSDRVIAAALDEIASADEAEKQRAAG